MKTLMMLGLVAIAGLATVGSASAAETHSGDVATAAPFATGPVEVSARKRQKHRAVPRAAYVAPAAGLLADGYNTPSYQRFYAEQRAGRCVMDEGYGRWTYCDNR